MSNVYCYIIMQSSFSLLSVECCYVSNLLISPMFPCLDSLHQCPDGWCPVWQVFHVFFGGHISLRCAIEKWPKMGPLYCLSWMKMCWWFFGGLLGCYSECCPYPISCVGRASLVHNHNQQDILVCNSYPWEPRYDVHCLQQHPFHHCHLSHLWFFECGVDKDAVKELF